MNLNKKRVVKSILGIIFLLLVAGSALYLIVKHKPTADQPSEAIPAPEFVAYPICFGSQSGDLSQNNGCNGKLSIALFASSPPGHEDNDLDVLVEVNHTPTKPDDVDNPEYDDRWHSYSITENADQEYDAEGNMIPDSWRSSNGFFYLDDELELTPSGVDTNRFRLTYYDPSTGDETLPVEQTLVFPMPLGQSPPQPL